MRRTRLCSRWSAKEIDQLRAMFAHATDAELTAAFPRHTLRAIKARANSIGARRASLVNSHVRERQQRRMAQAGAYLARRVAELGAATLTRAARSPAETLALDCLIYAAAALAPQDQQHS